MKLSETLKGMADNIEDNADIEVGAIIILAQLTEDAPSGLKKNNVAICSNSLNMGHEDIMTFLKSVLEQKYPFRKNLPN